MPLHQAPTFQLDQVNYQTIFIGQAGHITAEQLEEMIRTGKVIRTADGKLVMT